MLARKLQAPAIPPDADQRLTMTNVEWWQLETFLSLRGDRPTPRIAYLEGTLELMSPSKTHQRVKTTIARLLEAYAEEAGLIFNGYGSLTMKYAPRERAIEPDECYVVGSNERSDPDLAIEVIWTSGDLGKREIYRGLGVRELWEWRTDGITILGLRDGTYLPLSRSELLPALDVDLLFRHIDIDDQTAAVRAFRQAIRTLLRAP
jgi:Uma2 family endonuclease